MDHGHRARMDHGRGPVRVDGGLGGISRARFPWAGGEVGVVDGAGVGAASEIAGEAGLGELNAAWSGESGRGGRGGGR
jgi:hypothetical protein